MQVGEQKDRANTGKAIPSCARLALMYGVATVIMTAIFIGYLYLPPFGQVGGNTRGRLLWIAFATLPALLAGVGIALAAAGLLRARKD